MDKKQAIKGVIQGAGMSVGRLFGGKKRPKRPSSPQKVQTLPGGTPFKIKTTPMKRRPR